MTHEIRADLMSFCERNWDGGGGEGRQLTGQNTVWNSNDAQLQKKSFVC